MKLKTVVLFIPFQPYIDTNIRVNAFEQEHPPKLYISIQFIYLEIMPIKPRTEDSNLRAIVPALISGSPHFKLAIHQIAARGTYTRPMGNQKD